MSEKFPAAPRGLRPETKKWFSEIVREFVLEPTHVRLLTLACRAWDRQLDAREAISRNGLTFKDKHGTLRPRPEVVIERNSAILFSRLIRELRLSDAPEPDEGMPRNTTLAQRRKSS